MVDYDPELFIKQSDFPSAREMADKLERIAKEIWPDGLNMQTSGRSLMIKNTQMIEDDVNRKYIQKLTEYMKDKDPPTIVIDSVYDEEYAKRRNGIVSGDTLRVSIPNNLKEKEETIEQCLMRHLSK